MSRKLKEGFAIRTPADLRALLGIVLGNTAISAERVAAIAAGAHEWLACWETERKPQHVQSTKGEVVVAWLRAVLAGGPQRIKAILAEARKGDITLRMLEAAATTLNVKKRQRAEQGESFWTWELPASEV